MELGRYLVDAVVLEGRSYRDVARAHGVSKSWVQKLVARYRTGGYGAVTARSKAPHRVANRTGDEIEDTIVRVRKELTESGFDAGAQTIHYHLSLTDPSPPSVATIWRVLSRRGFVTPQPHKRPKSSYIRFEAALPNETWQSRRHLLGPRRRLKGRDPQLPRRLLEGVRRIQGARGHQLPRRRRDPLRGRRRLGSAGIASDRHSNSVALLESLDQAADETRIRGTGAHLPPLLDRTERIATPCLLITGRAGPPPGRRCVLLGTR